MGFLHLNVPGRKGLKEVIEKDWDRIEAEFSAPVKRRGEEYFSSGKVVPTDVMPHTAHFRSSGQLADSYSITLSYDGDTLLGMCTCRSDPPCKHIYASLFILKRKGGPEVREIVMRLHREEMAELLMDYLPENVKKALMEGPEMTLLRFKKYGDSSPLTGLLPFVPVIYDTFRAEGFVERAINAFKKKGTPCPHTLRVALRGIVRRAEDKVWYLRYIHEALTSNGCELPGLNFGDLLTEEERVRAVDEGVPYDLVRVEGEVVPERLSFSSADACLDYLLNTLLPRKKAREIARKCMDRFGLHPPLVLYYLQVGGEPDVALKLLSRRPTASMLLALKDLVPEETFSDLERLLKSLSPEEYAHYVAEVSPEELPKLKGMVDREVLTPLVIRNARQIGEAALPIIREEAVRIASGRRWSLYPKVAELLKLMREISPKEYERTLKYLKETFPNRRRLMEVLEE